MRGPGVGRLTLICNENPEQVWPLKDTWPGETANVSGTG